MPTYGNKNAGTSDAGLTKLLSLGEALGKVSACLAVMGYLSARWHWNTLGISMIKPLSLSAYLAETLLFAVQTVWRLALTGTIIIVVAGVLVGVLRALAISPSSHLP